MLGPLPRLHRFLVAALVTLAGLVAGAWVDLTLRPAGTSCADSLAGVCAGPVLNAMPLLAGGLLGLGLGIVLVHRRHQRPRLVRVEHPRRGRRHHPR